MRGKWGALVAAGLVLLGVGCSGPPPLPVVADRLADSLYAQMVRRLDPSRTRLLIYRVERLKDGLQHNGFLRPAVHPGRDIEQQLTIAFSDQFNLVESEHLEAIECERRLARNDRSKVPEGDLFERFGVRAVVVGDWVQIDDDRITASVRIVDLRSDTVIAADRRTYRFPRTKIRYSLPLLR